MFDVFLRKGFIINVSFLAGSDLFTLLCESEIIKPASYANIIFSPPNKRQSSPGCLFNFLKKEGCFLMKRKTVNTIGEMTNSRMAWNFNASTRVVQNKKGKGSYNRKRMKQKQTKEFL